METGEIIAVAAILLAIFALMWQINAQRGRLEDKIDRQSDRLEAEIKDVGQRVTDSELEQARLNGVNSVLTGQTHTHEDR